MRPLYKRKSLYYGCKVRNRAAICACNEPKFELARNLGEYRDSEPASQFGIGADRAVNYQCDSEGTALNYEVVSEAISSVRCSAPLQCPAECRLEKAYRRGLQKAWRPQAQVNVF